MKAICAAVCSVLLLFMLASVVTADELYPIRASELSPGPAIITGAVMSVDQEAGYLTVTVKPTNLTTLLPGIMTLSTDRMTKVTTCGGSNTLFSNIKVGEKVEVKYQANGEGRRIAQDISIITKAC